MSRPVTVCFYGPESTGKTELAQKLSVKYGCEWVPEIARELITTNNFTRDEIIKIGRLQTKRILGGQQHARRLLICDTDVITTQIYSQVYLGLVPDELYAFEKQVTYDHYFLFDIDVPWVADGLRDLSERRSEMFTLFQQALDSRRLPYTTIRGVYLQREDAAIKKIDELLRANYRTR